MALSSSIYYDSSRVMNNAIINVPLTVEPEASPPKNEVG